MGKILLTRNGVPSLDNSQVHFNKGGIYANHERLKSFLALIPAPLVWDKTYPLPFSYHCHLQSVPFRCRDIHRKDFPFQSSTCIDQKPLPSKDSPTYPNNSWQHALPNHQLNSGHYKSNHRLWEWCSAWYVSLWQDVSGEVWKKIATEVTQVPVKCWYHNRSKQNGTYVRTNAMLKQQNPLPTVEIKSLGNFL